MQPVLFRNIQISLYAAIAPRSSAEEYGLELIAEDIQEMEANFTRFGC